MHSAFKKLHIGHHGHSSASNAPPPLPSGKPELPGNKPSAGSYSSHDAIPQSHEHSPRIINYNQGELVHSRVIIIHGTAGPSNTRFDASVDVVCPDYPLIRWPCVDGHFKAVVQLNPGENNLWFNYLPPGSNLPECRSPLTIHYQPLLDNPPVNFVYLLGKDSPGTFDAPPEKISREGNGIETAVRKIRTAAYMMSAFTNEQMRRNGFGPRSFRMDESAQPDTLSRQDRGRVRNTANIHVLRCDKTVAELRDANKAQQNPNGNDTGALFGIAIDALNKAGLPLASNDKETYCAVLFADTHWDPQQNLVLAHAALGGGGGNLHLGIFGSHSLHAWPSSLEDIVPAFMDDTPTDTKILANDANQSGTYWEALNIGMGAWMHEIGHALGCPHQPSGIMLRDYVTWNRTFMSSELRPTRDNGCRDPVRPCLAKDECGWHRLDILRFRFHPSFRLPIDPPLGNSKAQVFPAGGEQLEIEATSGVYLVEIHDNEWPRAHFEFVPPQNKVTLTKDMILQALPEEYRGGKHKLEILSVGGQVTVDDYDAACQPYENNEGRAVYKSLLCGTSPHEEYKTYLLNGEISKIFVFSGLALDGVEIFYRNGESRLWGKRGGTPKEVHFDQGERLVGFGVRSGLWVDALQVITNVRRSPFYGGDGGGYTELVPPSGHQLVGLYGYFEQWAYGFGFIYS